MTKKAQYMHPGLRVVSINKPSLLSGSNNSLGFGEDKKNASVADSRGMDYFIEED